jgi:XRE family transcriptional regulator, stress-response regulator
MLLRHVTGAALRRIRLDDGRTLREVSRAANISMPYLSEIERGRKEPSSEILAGICAALGLTLVDLLNEVTAEAMVVDLTSAAASSVASASALPTAPVTSIRAQHGEVALAVAA